MLRPLPSPACGRCGAPSLSTRRERGATCLECGDWPPDLRAARAACLLRAPADALVHQLKYRGWRALADPIAERMAAVTLPDDVRLEAELCVPVPTTAERLRERGYHQAECIARAFARRTGRTLAPILHRERSARSQTVLLPAARRANVAGAFGVRTGRSRSIHNAHLLLVDDVLTTGATAVECALTLVAAGARCVSLIAFARALDARRLTET